MVSIHLVMEEVSVDAQSGSEQLQYGIGHSLTLQEVLLHQWLKLRHLAIRKLVRGKKHLQHNGDTAQTFTPLFVLDTASLLQHCHEVSTNLSAADAHPPGTSSQGAPMGMWYPH